ncbi:MAG: hypothetical protein SF162_09620 [bacterium]|nr:hypothetical protein [bacterium]
MRLPNIAAAPAALLAVAVVLGGLHAAFNLPRAVAQESGSTPGGSAPIARVDAGDFRALAVSTDGQWLMVADAAADQLRVYDLQADDQPLTAAVPLEGMPLDVAAGLDFAVTAVDSGGRTGLVQVIGLAPYDPAQTFAPLTVFDLPDRPRSVSISPDGAWAMVVSEGGWLLAELVTVDTVNTTFYPSPINDAILLNNFAVLAARNQPELFTAALNEGAQASVNRAQPLTLAAPAQRLTVNQNGTLAAALLTDGSLVLFDPRAMQLLATLQAGALADLRFLTFEGGEWLVLLAENRAEIYLVDVSDPEAAAELGSLPIEATPVQAITTYDDLIFVADRSSVRIWQAAVNQVQ